MYFLRLVSPPKTLAKVRLDFSATSTKLTAGWAVSEVGREDCARIAMLANKMNNPKSLGNNGE